MDPMDMFKKMYDNLEDPETCEHEYNYAVYSFKNGNMFLEMCPKCFDTMGTIERAVD